MSHEFESGAFNVTPAWHGLGVTVEDGSLTVERALEIASCDWTVVKVPATYKGQIVPETFFTVRESDDKVLGVVKARYRVIQNATQLAWIDALVGGGVPMETVGSLRGGRRVFITLKLPFASTILPEAEALAFHLFVQNSHDGSSGCKAQLVRTRVVCSNTWGFAEAEAKKLGTSVTIRHTTNAENRLAEAQRVLGLATGAAERSEAEAVALYKRTMDSAEFKAFLEKLVPIEDEASKRGVTMAQNVRDAITANYNREDETSIRHTWWGALQAVTRYDSHGLTGRNTTAGTAEENRLERLLSTDSISARAAELLAV